MVKTIGVTDNETLTKEEKLLMKHMVSYTWATFNERMRPVDGKTGLLRTEAIDNTATRGAE